jgi:sugar phosphate isomerase/epimerase
MLKISNPRFFSTVVTLAAWTFGASCCHAAESIWDHGNLIAWEVLPFDAIARSPDERAAMLERLGFRYYAFLSPPGMDKANAIEYKRQVDTEIEAMQRHGVKLFAWFYEVDDPSTDPHVRMTLESFEQHRVHPQLWIAQSRIYSPLTDTALARYYPPGFAAPSEQELDQLPEEERKAKEKATDAAVIQAANKVILADRNNPIEHGRLVQQEEARIDAFATLANRYGCRVEIYNHNDWFGLIENQLDIIRRLRAMGRRDVGMVYNFSHAHDEIHDDSTDFPRLWKRMKPYVVVVNVTGLMFDGAVDVIYVSQGHGEVEMMREIENSGWRGHVGVVVQRKGMDAEVVLRNDLRALDWAAAELTKPGSGGPRPFPADPERHPW